MKSVKKAQLIPLLLVFLPALCFSQQLDLNVILMQTTFYVQGSAKKGGTTSGTVFLLIRPFSAQPDAKMTSGRAVLVTAAHVLDDIAGETAEIFLRTQQTGTERWTMQRGRFAIRRAGLPLWKQLPDIDVAAMYVTWPVPTNVIAPTTMLADDAMLTKAGAGPGVALKVVGYPLGMASNDAFFPILRTGDIASYPLLPTKDNKTFLLDFRVFKGNSGGPVFYSPHELAGGAMLCCPPQFIMGLVSKEASLNMPYAELQLSLGQIVQASLIREVIESLPAPETNEATQAQVPVELITQATKTPDVVK
jgi:hypothetical protein